MKAGFLPVHHAIPLSAPRPVFHRDFRSLGFSCLPLKGRYRQLHRTMRHPEDGQDASPADHAPAGTSGGSEAATATLHTDGDPTDCPPDDQTQDHIATADLLSLVSWGDGSSPSLPSVASSEAAFVCAKHG